MKKNFIFILMLWSFFFSFLSSASAEIVREVGKKWDNVAVAPDTAWAIIDKDGTSVTEIKPSMNPSKGQPVKHTRSEEHTSELQSH